MATAMTDVHSAAADPPEPRKLPVYRPVRPPRLSSFIARLLTSPPQRPLAILRAIWPIPRVGRWAAVLRYEDVSEVLQRHDVFRVPFADEIARLNDGESPGTPFVLGMDDEDKHGMQAGKLMRIFRLEDLASVEVTSRVAATLKLDAGDGEIDGIRDLITAVPIAVCCEYYGVPVAKEEESDFAYAAIELSGHLFGFPPIEPTKARHEDPAGDYVRAIVDRAIDAAIDGASVHRRQTIVSRLVAEAGGTPDEAQRKEIRAILIGMIVGFVPTNTMAGGHILDVLLRNEQAMTKSLRAAQAGDYDGLARCLFEALRFSPINLGPFRISAGDFCAAAETSRAKKLKKGTIVLAMTSSAMFDSKQVLRPFQFDPVRPASNYMHFGFGMHWCVGAMIARIQITQTFSVLLERPSILRAATGGELELWGLFPDHLRIRYNVQNG